AVLAAIRAGHVFVDVWGTRNRLLEVTAEAEGARAEMGDVLAARAGARVVVTVHVVGAPRGARLTLAGDGAKLAPGSDMNLTAAESRSEARNSFELTADGAAHWLRADVRTADGKLLLLGNPIYLRPGT